MQTNILIIVLFQALMQSLNSKILKEEISNKELQLTLSIENEEEIIDFQNFSDQSYDQIKCKIEGCYCFFSSQNKASGELKNIQCTENTITFFRTNNNVKTISKENRYRIITEAYTDNDMPNSKTISSGFTLKWKFNNDGTIEFATIWNKLTWLGIGFGSSMRNVDMITINISGSTVNLIDLYSISDFTPPTDKSQDYKLISYSVGSSSVSTRFSRKLQTGDSKDKNLTKGSTYSWCYAYSNALSMEIHTYYAGFSITLSDSSSTGSSSSTSSDTSYTSTNTSSSTSTSDTSGSTSGSTKTSQEFIFSKIFLLFTIGISLVAF